MCSAFKFKWCYTILFLESILQVQLNSTGYNVNLRDFLLSLEVFIIYAICFFLFVGKTRKFYGRMCNILSRDKNS